MLNPWLATYGIILHVDLTNMQLMHFGWTGFKRFSLLVTQASKVTIFMAIPALVLSCKTLELFYVFGISTLVTSVSSTMGLVWIKSFLVGLSFILVFTWVTFLTFWSGLVGMLFLLALAWWVVCSLMPQKAHLGCLQVTCNFFYMSSSRLWGLHFLGKLPYLACWKPLQINIGIIHGFGDKLLIFEEKPEYMSMQDIWGFWWVIGMRHLDLNGIVPLISRSIALSEACQQVKSGSNFIGLWLVKIFILGPKDLSSLDLLWASTMTHIDPYQNLYSTLWLSCIF